MGCHLATRAARRGCRDPSTTGFTRWFERPERARCPLGSLPFPARTRGPCRRSLPMLVRFFCIALTSTVVFAQSYSPTHFAKAEGPTNNNFPFGWPQAPFRYSQIHDDVPA